MRRQMTFVLGAALFTAIAVMIGYTPSVAAAEVCYMDETGRIANRRRPGYTRVPCPTEGEETQAQPGAEPAAAQPAPRRRTARARSRMRDRTPNAKSIVPRPTLEDYGDLTSLPDRWRIVEALGYENNWWDPYHRNTIKGDVPVHGEWFFNLGVISDLSLIHI